MTIEGKVAKILDKHTLVANIGEGDGVEEGMHFLIYQPGEEIRDPDTRELLGTAPDVEKAEVVADEVKENMTIMESDTITYTRIKNPMNFQVPELFKTQEETVTERKELDTEKQVPEDRTKVKKGDAVRHIEAESEKDNSKDNHEESDSE